MEALILHRRVPRVEAERRARAMLEHVRIPECGAADEAISARTLRRHAPAGNRSPSPPSPDPDLIIADEPTTSLDVHECRHQIPEILKIAAEKRTRRPLSPWSAMTWA